MELGLVSSDDQHLRDRDSPGKASKLHQKGEAHGSEALQVISR